MRVGFHPRIKRQGFSPGRYALIEIASEMVALDQPNSCSRGTISTLGVARIPAATSKAKKVKPATSQP